MSAQVFRKKNMEERDMIAKVCWMIWKWSNELVWNQKGAITEEDVTAAKS